MSKGSCEIDTREVRSMLAYLEPKKMSSIYLRCLRSAGRFLQSKTREVLRREIGSAFDHYDFWNPEGSRTQRKHSQAIFMKAEKKPKELVKVRIPYFVGTKLWETGTTDRYTKKGQYRGSFAGNSFFTKALDSYEKPAEDKLEEELTKAIVKASNK